MLATALLVAALIAAVGYVRPRWIGLPLRPVTDLPARYRRLIGKDLTLFGGVGLIALLCLGRVEAVVTLPFELDAAAAWARRLTGYDRVEPAIVAAMIGGVLGGGLVGGLIARWRRRAPLVVGRIDALLPRDGGETVLAGVVSLVAGITEELFFRLVVPLLLVLATGQAAASFLVTVLLFGAMHRYQGWLGVAATTLVGVLLTLVYLASGALWLAMALHVAIDLNALVLRPLLARPA